MSKSESKPKLWGGCFKEETNQCLVELNKSLGIDKRLFKEDIDGSKAYAEILCNAGLLTQTELDKILDGLNQVKTEWIENKIKFLESDEDVHTVNERRLTELIGDVGGKLHTGRSRNDQVATDMRLWMKSALKELIKSLVNSIQIVAKKATDNIDIIMPGYTHLQRAQPVRFSHWILSHAFALQSDIGRFEDLLKRVDVLPLGSGAISGNPFNIDRNRLAKLLGFSGVTSNSMLAVSDRDFVAEFNFTASLTSIHLSRLAEDIIIYSTKEFGFLKLSDSYTTGSSLMPQKRNPDSLELIRGISGSIFGQSAGFMMTLKGLPSTYNKDLQSDKISMFTVYDQLKLSLDVISGVISTLKIDSDKCLSALSFDMLATDLAYFLVRKGVPFREAHHISGEVVAHAEKQSIPINEITLDELKKISLVFDESITSIWNFESSVEQYSVIGGTANRSVLSQIEQLENFIKTF